jgi:hypothetical protein
MSNARYAIPDEPSPSKLEHLVVDPMWPLFGLMLGGLWLALPWYVLNGIALGSPTRRREWLALAIAALGSLLLLVMIAWASEAGWIEGVQVKLALLSVTLLKLGMGFAVYSMQSRSFQLWEHFGGVPRNGLPLAVAGIFIEPFLLRLLDNGWLIMVLD